MSLLREVCYAAIETYMTPAKVFSPLGLSDGW